MIEERLKKHLATDYEGRLLIRDAEAFSAAFDYEALLAGLGYNVIRYEDVEQFRYAYESRLKNAKSKLALISSNRLYIPYDIRQAFYEITLSLNALYPKLNAAVLKRHILDIDLIDSAYDKLYSPAKSESETNRFIEQTVLAEDNIRSFINQSDAVLLSDAENAVSHTDWIRIARQNAQLEVYAARVGIKRNQDDINRLFQAFLLDGYQKLSGIVSASAPSILPKVVDAIAGGKVALVVADGMSLFDYNILSRHFPGFELDEYYSFALIPTTTSISRQCLLSGKYPQQLDYPFSLVKEESGFYDAGAAHGYSKHQCYYGRGYKALPGPFVQFAAIILNDIDDMVHGQTQGRQGMLSDVSLLAKSGKIQAFISTLLDQGFSVYLSADHGNTCCIGEGAAKRAGVETETKSKRMIVLKDFADISDDLSERTIRYPGYYLDKSFQYLICKGNTSFDNKDEVVMTHGGMTIEEVIVPFIKIRRKNIG